MAIASCDLIFLLIRQGGFCADVDLVESGGSVVSFGALRPEGRRFEFHSSRRVETSDTVSKFHSEAPQATARTCRRSLDSNPPRFGRKATNLPMSHHALH